MKRNGANYGLDLRAEGLALVRHQAGAFQAATRPLPAGLEPAELRAAQVAALRELATELEVGRHEVDLTIPRAAALEKQLTLPPVDDAELEALVRFQLTKDLPFDVEEMALAWQALPASGDGRPVHTVAVRRELVDELQSLLREAGLRPGRAVLASEATARTLVLTRGSDGRPLLLDLHRESTDIIIVQDGLLAFSRTSSHGPGEEGWQERLVGELSRTLIAAEPACGGPPDALYLAGSGADDDQLQQLLRERLGLSPELLPALGPKHLPSKALPYAAARGLADPTPVPGIPALDLVHAVRLRKARTRRAQLIAAGVTLGVLAVGALLVGRARLQAREAEVSRLEQERDELAPRARRATAVQAELDQARAWTARKGRELEILLAVTRALPPDEAYLTQLRWSEDGELQLTGRAKEWEVVGRFFAALDQDPLIEKADFADVRRPREKGALGYVFTGSARLAQGATP